MCQNCGNQNCGCTPKDYTSGIVYDGLKFNCPELAGIKPNCNNLNDLLELWGGLLCGLITAQNPFSVTTFDIGAWDMDNVSQVLIPHGLTATEYDSIVGASAIINNDAGTLKTVLGGFGTGSSNGSISIDATNIILDRTAGDLFDAAAYSGGSNRGKVIINYTKD